MGDYMAKTVTAPPKKRVVAKYKLAKHQIEASMMMTNSPQLGIFYEAGCGKTMCALDYLYQSFKNGTFKNALIICPASLVSNWKSSIDKMLLFHGYTRFGVEEMKKMVEIRSFQRTYEKNEVEQRHRDGTVSKIKKPPKIREDIRHEWGAIIIDESHCIGLHSSTQTKIAIKLAEYSDRRFIMTGTPVSGGGGKEDFKKLYGQLRFLDPDLWGKWTDFCAELVTSYDHFRQPKTYNEEKCRELMKNFGIVARLDTCYDMPDTMDIPIELELKCPEVYRKVQTGLTQEFGFEIRSGGGFFIKLLELVSGFMKADSDGKEEIIKEFPCAKLSAVDEILSGTEDRVVIFCNYTHSIDAVKRICEKHGRTVVFDGRSRAETWREFQYAPEKDEHGKPKYVQAKYLIAQYQSGGTGLDLYASHTTIFFEPSLSSLLMEQAKARTHRKGQTNKCLYYWLATKGTIEQKVVHTVRNGVEVTREMLNEWAKLREIKEDNEFDMGLDSDESESE